MYYRNRNQGPEVEHALKLPAQGELLGSVSKIVGASRFVVACTDGNERLCSIPGRFKRRFWIKVNDTVIVKPWIVQSNERGDIVFRYRPLDVNKLKERKLI
jgi:translation initiation factor 1A